MSHCCNCTVRVTNRAFHAYGVLVCLLLVALLVVGLVSLHAEQAQFVPISASLQRIEINQGVLIHAVNSLEAARPAAVIAPTPKPKVVVKTKTAPPPCKCCCSK